MFGNRVVRSRDAFGALFVAQVDAVYLEAWLVVRDPAAAADVTRETFGAAWADFRTAPPDMLGMWIVGRARDQALAWLGSGPSAPSPVEPTTGSDGPRPVSLDRLTLARIVASLNTSGVPTEPGRRRSADPPPPGEPAAKVGSSPGGDEEPSPETAGSEPEEPSPETAGSEPEEPSPETDRPEPGQRRSEGPAESSADLVFGSEAAFAAALGMPPPPGEPARPSPTARASDRARPGAAARRGGTDLAGVAAPGPQPAPAGTRSIFRHLATLSLVGAVGGVGLAGAGPVPGPGAENVGMVERGVEAAGPSLGPVPGAEVGGSTGPPPTAPGTQPDPSVDGGGPPDPEGSGDAGPAADITGAEEISATADAPATPVGEGSDAADVPGDGGGSASEDDDADPPESATPSGSGSSGASASGGAGSSGSGNTTTAPPSTEPPPSPPTVTAIHGTWLPSLDCRSDERMLTLTWVAGGADSARARPEGGRWRSVAPNVGQLTTCTDPDLRWYVEVSNAGGTDTASVELGV